MAAPSSRHSGRPPLWRRRILVEGFQKRFVVVQMLWLLAFLALFLGLLFGPLVWPLVQDSASPQELEAATQFLTLHRLLWPALAALVLGLTLVYIRLSHRVAGPLFRIKRIIGDVAEGTLTMRVQIRKGDYLQDEAAALDAMIQSVRVSVRQAKDDLATIAAHAATIRADLAAGRPVSTSDLSTLADAAASAGRALGRFTTADDGAGD